MWSTERIRDEFNTYTRNRPCLNCETEPAFDGLFCSDECQDEYEVTGAYAED